ncbi:MAG: penicillin acylase family protein [Marinovum sp.]|nr:penicillin acylase family protein [Marinovum sp.]
MVIVFRWLVRIASASIVLTVLAVAMTYYLASRSLPTYDKTLNVDALTGPVEIVRSNANVPHIFASNDPDAYFGLGYAHAQDRLWQMVVLRRTVQGRLSEVFGRRTLISDTVLRRLDLYPLAVQSVADQDAYTISALESYAAGVNARIAEINEDALGRGAPEFFIFNAPVAPWRPADSLAIIKLLALQLTGQADSEILRARTSLILSNEGRLQDLLPDAPGTGVADLPDFASLIPSVAPRNVAQSRLPKFAPWSRTPLAGASNAWAAAPKRSASGGTLLANDPHLGLSAPAVWYLARIDLETGGVMGATIPGIPTIMAGRSERLAWGLTSAYIDDQDLFVEALNPDNPEQYQTPGGFKDFETRRSIIEIKDETPITLSLRWTDNGPVLPPSFLDVGLVTPPGHVATLAWTALSADDTTMTAALGLLRAGSVEEAIAATEGFVAPGQNMHFIDRERIALQTVGHLPRRSERHQSQGRMPSQGWRVENRWQGSLPYSDNPRFVDSAGGIVGNTNNKTVERPFPKHVSYTWGDTQRVNRWERLIQAREVHTRDSFIETQLDTVSFTAQALLPLVGRELWFTGEAAPEGTIERERQRALTLLAEWNGEMNEHLPEPLIYASWMRAVQDRLIRDDLGPLADAFTHVEPLFIERVFRNIDGAAAWCDVIQSSLEESCADIARLALDDAVVWLQETYGTSLESLRWGDAHQATQDHQTLGEVPVLRYIVNIRQSTSGGDNTLNRGRTSGEGENPFLNVHGPAYRGVYDFADPDSSVFIISTGQSGHFLSRHYDDLGTLWRRGEYIPMSLDADLARAAARGTTMLIPN